MLKLVIKLIKVSYI